LLAHVEPAAFVVGLLESLRQVGGADIVVSATAGTGTIAVVRLAVFLQPLGASGEVGVEVRRDAVLGAGAAVLADAVAVAATAQAGRDAYSACCAASIFAMSSGVSDTSDR
jgi:hypothetical protein